ncbi:MAG: GNAT family N-acetyltransferase [Bacillota bacterium]
MVQVSLRPVALADLDLFKMWWADSEADRLDSGVVREGPKGEFLDRVGRLLLTGGLPSWRVIDVTGVGPVGYILHRDLDPRTGSVELAIRLGREHWDRGYGTAATRLFADYLFDELGAERVWLEVVETNGRARRMYRKAGFIETARHSSDRDRPAVVVMEAERRE